MKKIISTIIILLVIVAGAYFLFQITKQTNQIKPVEFDSQGLELPGEQKQRQQEQQAQSSTQMSSEEFWSQLRAEILKQGTGEGAKSGDQLTVHYVGVLEDGTKFDSSVDRGQPFSFTLGAGQVIQGWDLGLMGMKKGEIRRLYIPSQLGYGEAGAGSIPPNANLIFEVELLEINQ
jgi:FKBP-type peptidyl-prolyl cis-trans isomerase